MDRSSVRRAANVAPAEPAPTTTKSYTAADVARSGRRAGRRCFLYLDNLEFDGDLDLVAHDEFAVGHHAHGQAEVFAIDFAFGAVGDAVAHARVVDLAIALHAQRHRLGDAFDRQIADHAVTVITSGLDARDFEADRRVRLDVQEVLPAQIVVALRVVGADAGRVDRDLDR